MEFVPLFPGYFTGYFAAANAHPAHVLGKLPRKNLNRELCPSGAWRASSAGGRTQMYGVDSVPVFFAKICRGKTPLAGQIVGRQPLPRLN